MRHATLWLVLVSGWTSAPALAQIDTFVWTLTGNETGSGFQTPTQLHVTGPDGGSCTIQLTWFDTVLPVGGSLHVLADFQNLDSWTYKGQDEYDSPAWVVDGVYAQPPGQGTYSGWPTGPYTIDFEAEAGQHVGLGVWAADCYYGPGVADFHDLVFLPKPWSTHAAALDPRDLWTLPDTNYVQDMVGSGDVNLDGVGDILLGGGIYPNNVTIVSGVDGSTLLEAESGFIGVETVASVGDVDGDGHPDIAAAYAHESSAAGAFTGGATILSGADGTELLTVAGTAKWDELGEHLAGVGDIDLDGVPDLAASLPKPFSTKSEVRVFSGATGALLHAIFPGPQTHNFGKGLAGGSDFSGDGVPDVLIGTPAGAGVGIYSGGSGGLVKSFPSAGLGAPIVLIGDADGDGLADVAVGGYGTFATFSGASASQLTLVQGDGQLGVTLAGGADVNGDGRLDVIAGAPTAAPGGAVRVFDALDGSLVASLPGTFPGEHVGQLVAMPGDVDGDGLGDVVGFAAPVDSLSAGAALQAWSQLGHAGPPLLTHAGEPQPYQSVSVTIGNLAPGQAGFLVLGGALADVPIAGGLLAPSPDVLIPVLADAGGEATISARWPAGLPTWSSLWMQAWMLDPAGPAGFSASDALGASQL